MADIAPTIPSRLVQIDAVRLGEDVPADGTVTFTLTCDLRDPVGTRLLAAGSRTVELVNGKGELLLPVHADGVVDQDGSTDWVIVVTKSWHRDHSYAIRVPVGTAPINLASLSPIRELTESEKAYAITAVAVNVVAAATPSGTATLSGGTMSLNLGIPKGDKGDPGATVTLTSGTVTTLSPEQPASASLGPVTGPSAAPTQALNLAIPKGDKGDKGDQGDKGDPGTSVTIKGTKNATSELPPTGNTVGDGYIIAGNLHVWTSAATWENVGPIQGPPGKDAATFMPDGLVTTSKLADEAVTDAKLANSAVTDAKLATGAITTTKLADNAVTDVKLADSAVTPAKIVDAAVEPRHISLAARRALSPWFNVRDYGAVGDGTTDDTNAIKSAVAAAGENNVVYFPRGRYRITDTVTMSPDSTWLGTGIDDKGTANRAGSTNHIFADIGADVNAIVTQYNTRIENLAVYGRETGVGTGIRMSGQISTRNVSVRGFDIGVALFSMFYGDIQTLRTMHNNVGVKVINTGTHNTTFTQCRINATKADGTPGVGVWGNPVTELTFSGGAIENFQFGLNALTGCQINLFGTYFEVANELNASGTVAVNLAGANGANVNMFGVIAYTSSLAHLVQGYTSSAYTASLTARGTHFRGNGAASFMAYRLAAHPGLYVDISGGSWETTGATLAGSFMNLSGLTGASRVVWPDNSKVIKGPLA